MAEKITRTEQEWRELLTEEQFQITRNHGTEPAFTGEYNDCKLSGNYECICCGNQLFESGTKYDSGSGWPSFWAPSDESAIELRQDNSFMMRRTEVVCAKCDAHLGHVFDDGPAPTGKRFCMNSAALKLKTKD